MQRTNVITGITGQDGSLLAKKLLERGEKVIGIFRRSSSDNFWRLRELGILERVQLFEADIQSYAMLHDILRDYNCANLFHFAGSSYTAESFDKPWNTFVTNTHAVFQILESIRRVSPETNVLIAGSSEIFGATKEGYSTEIVNAHSPCQPTNPYGLSHLSNLQSVNFFRQTYGLQIALPIMFNHESEYRGSQFVSKKIVKGCVDLKYGNIERLELGNLNAQKDWGSAKEFVDLLVLISDQSISENFVLGTGRLSSVRQILEKTFEVLQMPVRSVGSGKDEQIVCCTTGRILVSINPIYFRLRETPPFKASISEMDNLIGYHPQQVICDLIPEMIEFELNRR